MKENELQIICVLSDTIRVGLKDTRENYGHDDSIPFQADVYVEDGPPGSGYRLLAYVWNDGWGGDSQMKKAIQTPETDALVEKMQPLCKKHMMIYEGESVCPYTLKLLCTCMAEAWLYCQKAAKSKTVFYRFDDDPVTIKNNGANLYQLK